MSGCIATLTLLVTSAVVAFHFFFKAALQALWVRWNLALFVNICYVECNFVGHSDVITSALYACQKFTKRHISVIFWLQLSVIIHYLINTASAKATMSLLSDRGTGFLRML